MTWLQEMEYIKVDQANIKAQYEQVGNLVPCQQAFSVNRIAVFMIRIQCVS